MYIRYTIPWKLSCDLGTRTRAATFKLMKHKDNANDYSLTQNTASLSKFALILPVVVLFCSCGTVAANECRVNPYASNTRRIVTAVLVYTIAFLTLVGGVTYISILGIYSYGDYKLTAELLSKFVDLKSCSDTVLDKAGEKGLEMTASENRLYLIAGLAVISGILILIMFVTVISIPFCCKPKGEDSTIMVMNHEGKGGV